MNNQTTSPLRYVVYSYSHHSPHSGYSHLADYGQKILGAEVIPLKKPVSKLIVRDRVYWWLAKGTPGYTREAISAELKVARGMLTDQDAIYHFLYGETTYHYAGLLNHHRGNKLMASFHAPLVSIKRRVQVDWHLKQLSGVVCLGRNQMEYFSKIVGPKHVFFIPHGIDLEYFSPPNEFSNRDPDLCVFVGENYRDFPTLRGVIELVCYKRPQTRFIGVIPERCYELIGKHPNLVLRSGVPEEELLNLYQTASLMVLPLKEAVANNAVLEAMACGLPQVTTKVGSALDYVNTECAALLPKQDAQKMAETVLALLQAPQELERMSKAAIKRASEFSWPKVITQLSRIYSILE